MRELFVVHGPYKGKWMKVDPVWGAIQYMFPLNPRTWTLEISELEERDDEIGTLYVRCYYSPSWKITLEILAEYRDLEPGTVMPGWIVGQELESSPLCQVCRKCADTPTGRWCFRHLMDYMREIGL
jgi:hypothetical protein